MTKRESTNQDKEGGKDQGDRVDGQVGGRVTKRMTKGGEKGRVAWKGMVGNGPGEDFL